MGTLYLVATPIGNLEDITSRAIRVLREARLIAAEDTRHTGRLLRHFEIATPLISYHAHNERARQATLLAHLAAGDVALVSDAGTPGLSDPGVTLVRAAVAAGYPVVPVPGPSALLAAVTASGLVADHFTFLGFLPRPASAADRLLTSLATLPHPLVLFEAPHRLIETLARLLAILGDRPAAACRELTKMHEEFRRDHLAGLLGHYRAETPRGEFVLVVAGAPPPAPPDEAQVAALLDDLLARGQTPSQAARQVAQRLGVPRQAVYQVALARVSPSTPGSSPHRGGKRGKPAPLSPGGRGVGGEGEARL